VSVPSRGSPWAKRLGGIGDEAALGIAGQIAAVRSLGWHQLELRTVDGTDLSELPARAIDRIAGEISEAGLSVPCVDSRIGNWAWPITRAFSDDLAELDAVSHAARRLGARYIRVMSYQNDGLTEHEWAAQAIRRLKLLAARAADADLVLLHENCSGWAGRSAARAVTLLSEVDSPGLRALFDIGNPVAHGYDGPAYLAEVLPWVEHVHVKDALTPPADGAAAHFTAPGEGTARLAHCMATLLASGYQGVFSIEPHVAVVPHTGSRADPDVVAAAFCAFGRRFDGLVDGLLTQPATARPGAARAEAS
jgi:L-ribulose-5-phosphate 3-epimerase